MNGQIAPPSVTPYAPQAPQSQMLAQALAAMRSAPPTTPGAAMSDLAATAMLNARQQANGQGGAGQWTGIDGKPSGNWFDSNLGSQVGGLFGLGKSAQTQAGLNAASQLLSNTGVMGAAF